MDAIVLGDQRYAVERARLQDLPDLVALLTDDPLGAHRETTDLTVYQRAFDAIDRDPHQFLAAVRDPRGVLVATMQLTVIPGLSRGGTTRLQIEAVRVADSARGSGLGSAMFAWAHDYGRGTAPVSPSSPPTRPGRTPTASTRGSATRGPTKD